LDGLCRNRLKAARGFYGGDVYRRIGLRSRQYDGFNLVWDAPTRIVVIAYCWDGEALRQTRDDLLHLHVMLPQVQVYKKLHLVLFHADSANAADQPWPAGISFSPIALDPAAHVAAPPEFVAVKLDSVLGIPAGAIAADEAAATGGRPPNWRLFLQDDRDIVMRKIKELAGAKADLPADLQTTVDKLLTLAETDAPDLPEQVRQVLNALWEVPADAAARTNS
jgi:hypothetical protein